MNERNSYRLDLWLYNELQKRGMTMLELSEKAGVSYKTVLNCVHNVNSPSLYTLALILNALDAHIEFVSN